MADDRVPKFDSVPHPRFLDRTPGGWLPTIGQLYCRHCIVTDQTGGGWANLWSIKNHLAATHDYDRDEVEEGHHYFGAIQLRRLLLEYWTQADEAAARFTRQLGTIVGADDFLTDCG